MERFLQLCAIDNMIVADCTTPSNFYHLLRRQMKRDYRKPLIVFTPKSLLRHPLAVSAIEEFGNGTFQEVIDDTINPEKVTKLVFCTGKFYYDLLAERTALERNDVALVRRTLAAPDNWKEYGVESYANFEVLPTYNYTTPHNLLRWTQRTEVQVGRSCSSNCHIRNEGGTLVNKELYLFDEDLLDWEKSASNSIIVDGKLPESWFSE